jgi:UDP-N-acetyl-D-glucosamine dehydrogenase
MPAYVVKRVIAGAGGLVKGKSVVVVGVAYKANVADTRETPAAGVIDLLRAAGALVTWHDPLVGDWRSETSSELVVHDVAVVVTKHDVVSISDIKKSSYIFDCTGSIAGADGI